MEVFLNLHVGAFITEYRNFRYQVWCKLKFWFFDFLFRQWKLMLNCLYDNYYLWQMDEIDSLSQPDIPYPYEMSWRFNKIRINPFFPQAYVQNKL